MKKEREAIKKLIDSDISALQISRETGISDRLIGKYRRGESKIGGMTLDTAEALLKYIKKLEDEKMKFENLQVVNYYNGEYELEFNVNGEFKYITVDESDHPEAATDEDYFDNKEVVERIIAEHSEE